MISNLLELFRCAFLLAAICSSVLEPGLSLSLLVASGLLSLVVERGVVSPLCATTLGVSGVG